MSRELILKVIMKKRELDSYGFDELQRIRVDQYGRWHAKCHVPDLCFKCFVEKDKNSPMCEVESKWGNGSRDFVCDECGDQITIWPPVGGYQEQNHPARFHL